MSARAITSSRMYVTIIDLLAVRTGTFTRVFVETMTGREAPLVFKRDETEMFAAVASRNVKPVANKKVEVVSPLCCDRRNECIGCLCMLAATRCQRMEKAPELLGMVKRLRQRSFTVAFLPRQRHVMPFLRVRAAPSLSLEVCPT